MSYDASPSAPPYDEVMAPLAPPGGNPPSAGDPPPPSYAQVSETLCSFVDFSPSCLESGGFFSLAAYETFDVLVNRANQWLQSHHKWKVISCESIESKVDKYDPDASVDTVTSTYTVHSEKSTYYNRSLRVWVCNKTPADNPEPQQLGYFNLVPEIVDANFFSKPEFRGFAETIDQFNAEIFKRPLEGRIINMETQAMKFSSYDETVHADVTIWRESGDSSVYFLNVIRLFYEKGQGVITRVGKEDFIPRDQRASENQEEEAEYSEYEFLTFGQTMGKVNRWIRAQDPNINVCNVQSLDCKVRGGWSGGYIDTDRSLYCEHGDRKTKYARIIRLYWVDGSDYTKLPRETPLVTTYRTFLPCQLTTGGWGMGAYETQPETAKRMNAWINATGAKVISCETIKLRMWDGRQDGDPEVTYVSDHGEYKKRYILALRLYIDGAYKEPPPGVLPPEPEIQEDDDCCTIL